MTEATDDSDPTGVTGVTEGLARSSVLRPGIRTFKPRRSRITPRAEEALSRRTDLLIPVTEAPVDLDATWPGCAGVIMEIGCGDGRATVAMAQQRPHVGIWAVDVHTPGLGTLLADLEAAGVDNVRVTEADALAVLEHMVAPHGLTGVRSFFPDPWPKARHHKRRLVQPAVLALIRSRLQPGGTWHLATDWPEYAESIQAEFAADPGWTGGVIERPADRPVTHYEQRALREGRTPVDLRYTAV